MKNQNLFLRPFLALITLAVATSSCSSTPQVTQGSDSAPTANREIASIRQGNVLFIFDESVLENRVMAIKAIKDKDLSIYTCKRGKVISNVIEDGLDAEQYVGHYCKHEVTFASLKDAQKFTEQVDAYLGKSNVGRWSQAVVAVAEVVGAGIVARFGLVEGANAITHWGDRLAAKYITDVPTSFYESSYSILRAIFNEGDGNFYKYFKSAEARDGYEALMKTTKVVRYGATAIILTAAAAGVYAAYSDAKEAANTTDERIAVRSMGVTIKDLFPKGAAGQNTPDVGLATLFSGFRQIDPAYATWGQF